MNTIVRWLARLRTSTSLDTSNSSSPGDRTAAHDPESRRLANSILGVDRDLREASDLAPEPPAWLHQGIMHAIQAECASPTEPECPRRRWLWAVGFATSFVAVASALILVLTAPHRSNRDLAVGQADTSSLESVFAAGSPGETLDRVALLGASAITSPFERELGYLSADVTRAADFVLAALP